MTRPSSSRSRNSPVSSLMLTRLSMSLVMASSTSCRGTSWVRAAMENNPLGLSEVKQGGERPFARTVAGLDLHQRGHMVPPTLHDRMVGQAVAAIAFGQLQ